MNKVERPPTPDSPTETPQLPPDNAPHKAAPGAKSEAKADEGEVVDAEYTEVKDGTQ